MSDIRPKVPSNGSLLVQSDGSVQLAGRIAGDPNQVVTFNQFTSTFESTDASLLGIGTGGSSGSKAVVTISPTPPPNAESGDLWWNSTVGRLFIYYDDSNTAQWVDASPNGGGPGQTKVTISDTPPGGANEGDLWWNDQDGRLYIYYIDSNTAQWVDTNPNGGGPGGGGNVTISDTPPPSPSQGDLWWNDQDGRLYIYYDDGNSAQWVDTNPNGGGTGGGTLSLVSIGTDPPANPSQGALWWNSEDGRLFVYYNDGQSAQWVDASPNGGQSDGASVPVTVSDIPPGNPVEGQLWWNTTDGRLFVFYDDGQSAQWVDASPNGGAGADVTKTTISDTPPANPNDGDLWWNNEDGRFYIYYDDGQSAQWVDTNPNGGGPPPITIEEAATNLSVTSDGGGTFTITDNGFYSRLGNQVTLCIDLTIDTLSGESGDLLISGLPYECRSGQCFAASVAVSETTLSQLDSLRDLMIRFTIGGTNDRGTLTLIQNTTQSTDPGITLNSTSIRNGARFLGTLTYFV